MTVSHPSQANNPVRDGESQLSASLGAAHSKKQQKETKYLERCQAQGVVFVAAAICCYGGWLDEAEDIVNTLAERSAYRSGVAVSVVKGQFWQRLSIALWRGNADLLLHYA